MKTRISPKTMEERKELILNTINHIALMEQINDQTIYTGGFYDKFVKNSDTFSYSTVFTACKKTGKTAKEILANKYWQNEVVKNFYELREMYSKLKDDKDQLSLDLEEKYTVQEWAKKFKEMNIEQKDNQVKFTFQEVIIIAKSMGIELTQTITKKIN